MKKSRGIFFILLFGAAILLLSWFGYHLYRKIGPPSESPFNAIPGNTALIIKLNKAGNLLEELNRSNLLWKAISRLPGIDSVRKELQFVDSASRKNEKINKIFQQYHILITISLSGPDRFASLYLASVGGSDPESYILDFIHELSSGKARVTQTPYYTTQLHKIQVKGNPDPFYFAILKGVFMASYHPDLIKKAIDRLSLNTPLATSTGFRMVEATSGKKADANIYVNYRFFSLAISKMIRPQYLPELIRFAYFADWSGLDLIIKKDELLFNGITVAPDSNQHFLSLFNGQKPQKTTLAEVIPEEVLFYTTYGWSDPGRFSQRVQNKTPRIDTLAFGQNALARLLSKYKVNITSFFLPWMGNEGGLFALQGPKNSDPIVIAAFACPNVKKTLASLQNLSTETGISLDSASWNEQQIYTMALPGFLPAIFGDLFGEVDAKCFTFINGYLFFASKPNHLEPVIKACQNKATLAMNKKYVDFISGLNEKSNVLFFLNAPLAVNKLNTIFKQGLTTQLGPVMDTLRKFESMAFQFSAVDGLFYSNLLLRYDPNQGKEGPLEWETKLDTTIIGRPKILQASANTHPIIMVSDIAGNLYRINADGTIAWKLRLMGDLKGDIHPIHFPSNDSLFLIFNTGTHLYLIHEDGCFADRFPMRFPLMATNPITLIPTNNKYGHNILVAFQDHRVYNFNMDGQSSIHWKRPELEAEIDRPVEYHKIKGRVYLLISDRLGHTRIVDQNGSTQISLGSKFSHAPHSGFYPNKTNKKGIFLTTSPQGNIVFIEGNGRTSETAINRFSPSHRYFYEEITRNKQPVFIFTDKNRIDYYNHGFKLLYSHNFRRDMTTPPFLIHLPDKKIRVGMVSPETNELYLFDKNGNRELESGIRGNTPFDIGYLTNTAHLNLIVGSGNNLRNYRLTKF